MVTKITKAAVRKLADAAGISIGASEGGPYPTMDQLMVFLAEAQKTRAVDPSDIQSRAVKLAKKHKLFAGRTPSTIGERWAVDAIVEALSAK